jgi:hypothetical protein
VHPHKSVSCKAADSCVGDAAALAPSSRAVAEATNESPDLSRSGRTKQRHRKEAQVYFALAHEKHGADIFAEALADYLSKHAELRQQVQHILEGRPIR